MPLSRIRPVRSMLAAAIASTVVLTGCGLVGGADTASPSPTAVSSSASPSTSVGAAGNASECDAVITEVNEISAEIVRLNETIATDPLGAIGLVGSITDRIGSVGKSVSDPELQTRIAEIQASWDSLVSTAEGAITSGDADAAAKIGASIDGMRQQVTELQEYCNGAG